MDVAHRATALERFLDLGLPIDRRLKRQSGKNIVTNSMPEVQIVVLDEPFKASSAILNVILSLINERVFDNSGQRIDVPMVSLYGASN